MDTPHDIHHPHELFLWFADDGLREVERCDDTTCEVCAAAEPMPLVDDADRVTVPHAA